LVSGEGLEELGGAELDDLGDTNALQGRHNRIEAEEDEPSTGRSRRRGRKQEADSLLREK
jgi:hypothetical protein